MNATPASRGRGPLFVFAGGGTGGHLYPALAVADAIFRQRSDARFAFWGTQRPIDQRILGRVQAEFVAQSLPSFSVLPWRLVGALMQLRTARRVCRNRFQDERPAVVMGTGGMASVPPIREAARLGVPTALFNPDAIPGRANRHLARFAHRVFVQFPESRGHFGPKTDVEVSGCPVRADFFNVTREAGRERFGLDRNRKTLLVTGASLGARSVNQAVVAIAAFLAEKADWQVLHLTGTADHDMVLAGYRGVGNAVKVVAYTDDMAHAMAAADLIVSRAGASTLAEILAVRRPAILMPYPHHKDQHQLANARCASKSAPIRIVTDAVDSAANAPALRAALEEMMKSVPRGSAPDSAPRDSESATNAAEHIARRLILMSEGGEQRPIASRSGVRLESVKTT